MTASSRLLEGRLAGVIVDTVLVVAWIVAVTLAFRLAGWPLSAYYVVVFGGVIGYSLAVDPWAWRG